MDASTASDYTPILTRFIQQQIRIFGPDVVRIKLAGVAGLQVSENGAVRNMSGDPQTVLTQVTTACMSLSDFAVKQTMEALAKDIVAAPVVSTPAFATVPGTGEERPETSSKY